MNDSSGFLAQYAQGVAGIAIARLVPFAVYAALAHRRLGVWRLSAVALALLPCAVVARGALPGLAQNAAWTLSYFGVAACLSHALRGVVASRRMGRVVLFMVGFVVYLLIPAAFAPPRLTVVAVVLGWELTLSAFSYTLESAKQGSTLNDALFFLLVNPVLVYPDRGKETPDASNIRPGLARIALGMGAISANYAMLFLLTTLMQRGALSRETHFLGAGEMMRVSAYYAGQCLGLYFIHSGVASLQIGSMSILGWSIPERYDYPFLACSPAQFWRRWNIYIGSWVRRYVFFPLITHLRRQDGIRPAVATVLGVLIAFGAMGFFHDCVPYLSGLEREHGFVPALTAVFIAHGAALLVFEGATRWIRVFLSRHDVVPGTFTGRAGLGVSWVTLRLVNQSLAWIAIPVLSRGELPAALARHLHGALS